jgi:hypothetical protein
MTRRICRAGLLLILCLMPAAVPAQQAGLTAVGLWDEMARDQPAFEAAYKGKKVSFLGEVASVQRNFAKQLVVKFKAGGVRTIECEFPEIYARPLSKIKPGQRVKVSGHYRSRVVMTLYFERCEV